MNYPEDSKISVVVPLYNEGSGLTEFSDKLISAIQSCTSHYEIIYCDDGSNDNTAKIVSELCQSNPHIKLVKLSRNFGKENALAAGIAQASGDAIITLDGDGEHPPELIPEFIKAWLNGAQVVIGLRADTKNYGLPKRVGTAIFYKTFKQLTGHSLTHNETDYRLISREVQQAFLDLKETDRVTRGLIDWLGFSRAYVPFKINERQGKPTYGYVKLAKLAIDSFVSLSFRPLYLFGYLGLFITFGATVLGLSVIVEQLIMHDPLGWKFTGTAMLGILTLFLVGIILVSQATLALYIAHIHSQVKQRPLYVIDHARSIGIKNKING